jgi:hypothetical protein
MRSAFNGLDGIFFASAAATFARSSDISFDASNRLYPHLPPSFYVTHLAPVLCHRLVSNVGQAEKTGLEILSRSPGEADFKCLLRSRWQEMDWFIWMPRNSPELLARVPILPLIRYLVCCRPLLPGSLQFPEIDWDCRRRRVNTRVLGG